MSSDMGYPPIWHILALCSSKEPESLGECKGIVDPSVKGETHEGGARQGPLEGPGLSRYLVQIA
jgi:hypothetical protein